MMVHKPALNDEKLLDSLDEVEQIRDQALLRIQKYQQAIAHHYNQKVRPRLFSEGDLVLRKVYENTTELNAGKVGDKWEGPYQISRIVKPSVYELMAGEAVPRSWNSINLKQYYY